MQVLTGPLAGRSDPEPDPEPGIFTFISDRINRILGLGYKPYPVDHVNPVKKWIFF
jgi:hypothetical protein